MKKGKIIQWNDEKGFGFIASDDGSEKVFFHISCVKTSTRRPRVSDRVVYESARDDKSRLNAKAVVIEGTVANTATLRKSQPNQVTPPRKNPLDYLLIVILLGCLGGAGWGIYQARVFDADIAPYVFFAVAAWIILYRQKKPKEKQFCCARCKAMVNFDKRTIQAWNNGLLKLYCGTCHQRWLDNKPAQPLIHSMGRNGGCLGILCLLITLPVTAGIALIHWLI